MRVSAMTGGCTGKQATPGKTVVAYVSEDQGCLPNRCWRTVFDTEEAESTGVMNRLLGTGRAIS